MEGIYGYKEKDVIGLAKFIDERKGQSLSKTFESYAVISGKAKGTVRNLYYGILKENRLPSIKSWSLTRRKKKGL